MARYDKLTQDFIENSLSKEQIDALKEQKHEHEDNALKPFRVARAVINGIDSPKRAIGKAIFQGAVKHELNKEGALTASQRHVIGIYKKLNSAYGRDWWGWEPETIWQTLGGEANSKEFRNLVMAIQVTLNTFQPFEHWNIFEKIGHAFNTNDINFSILQPLEPHEIALTLHVLSKIRPHTPYAEEIGGYIASCAKHAGVVYLPDTLFPIEIESIHGDKIPGCQRFLDNITHEYALRDEVKSLWEKKDAAKTPEAEIQLARLKEIEEYISDAAIG